jgi:hypothetical protein
MRLLTLAGGAARTWAPRVAVAWTRGVIQAWTRGVVVVWTRGVVRGWARGVVPGWSQVVIAVLARGRTGSLGRAVILSVAGGSTLAVIPARPCGMDPGLARAVAPAGTVPVRIR